MTQDSTADRLISAALRRLRDAADALDAGWSPSRWRIVDENGDERPLKATFTPGSISSIIGGVGELDLDPGVHTTLRTTLEVPETYCAVDLAGDSLEVTVGSLYPTEIRVDGQVLLSEAIPPVATGPALIEVTAQLTPGWSAEMDLTIRPLDGQRGGGVTWVNLKFTTPRLRAHFERIDLAWARLALASRLAATPSERSAVEAAAKLVPEQVLETDPDEVLHRVALVLEPVSHRVKAMTVHVVGHAHIDLAWLWTWDDTREVIKRDVRSMLAIMDDYPEATFTHSQPAGYEVIRQEEPELFEQILKRVHEGRWEPATSQWVEGDTNMASGEAMVSQLLEGVAFSKEHLGITPRVFLAPDTFGHSANMPQLVADAGADIYYHMRCNPGASQPSPGGQNEAGLWPAYWWEGIDGTRVFACSTPSYNGQLTPGAIARAALDAHTAGLGTGLLFIGVGDHGGAPTRNGYDTLRRVADTDGMPRAQCSTVAAYADAVRASGTTLPVHRGESPRIFEGCYTTHADAKLANRDAENRMVTAETLTALAGLSRPPDLTERWRDVCFHQFHDILCGSGIPEVYKKTHDDHARLVETTTEAIENALPILFGDLQPGSVGVVNPHGYDCTDVVTVPAPDVLDPIVVGDAGTVACQVSGDELMFVASVGAFGAAPYRIEDGSDTKAPGPMVSSEADGYLWVETSHFIAAVRVDCGIITSLVDKRVDRELVAWGMRRPSDYADPARPDLGLNVFQVTEERPHSLAAWQYQEVAAEHTLLDGATTEVMEDGPVRAVVRVTHVFRSSTISEDLIFYRDLPRVDFTAQVDWQEPGGPDVGIPNLVVGFTPDVSPAEAWFEVPGGAVPRSTNGQRVPALRWVDVGGDDYGVAVLNDSVYGHEVLGTRIRLALIRTAYMPDPRSDHGEHEFRFSLVPHVGGWRDAAVPNHAALFNQPLIARVADAELSTATAETPPWRPHVVADGGVVTTTLRVARDGSGTVLRLAETSGRHIQVVLEGLPNAADVWNASVSEQRRTLLGSGSSLGVSMRPWEIRTLIVESN